MNIEIELVHAKDLPAQCNAKEYQYRLDGTEYCLWVDEFDEYGLWSRIGKQVCERAKIPNLSKKP